MSLKESRRPRFREPVELESIGEAKKLLVLLAIFEDGLNFHLCIKDNKNIENSLMH